ncbi:hypothetical protein BJ970_005220 [Saccharopolyspora phatthalungensis]|uniref:DUF397 domain-containing protein n=1 Tax=Saccharopolyspora phatthalungensis TaxID=664693 RepID=A0A840QB93_9PSEU|nr:DUF397 domain-containing protein [Saccharopolyspora phatthalungensis]MBB5157686.1 hypothetical protein [Saccharopolyspora phatthalungensis]
MGLLLTNWRTSSHSKSGGQCVEVGRVEYLPEGWRKSSRSGQQSACVEVGRVSIGAAVRDTKDRAAGYFTTTHAQWSAFISAVKDNRFVG